MATPRLVGPEAVPLERVSLDELARLFELERAAWRDVLGWDAAASTKTLTAAVEWGVLRGAALCLAGRPLGYLVLQPGFAETRLCGVYLPTEAASAAPALVRQALAEAPRTSRLEGQLLAFATQTELDLAFGRLGIGVECRDFLEYQPSLGGSLHSVLPGPVVMTPRPRLSSLDTHDLEACAQVLVAAHAGGVEARINQAFRTVSAALAYLREVVDVGGCGPLQQDASAVVSLRGRVVGFCIATTTGPGVGHVPQIALDPAVQGRGLGSVLLGHALESLVADGCRRVTLSVSRSNGRASAWYRRVGFRPLLPFASYTRDASG